MKTSYSFPLFKYIFILFLCSSFSVNAQEDSEIIMAYEDYAGAPREIAYVHLNKSTFIKNEMLGFTSYIFDKSNKRLSSATTNLYCTITDSTNKIIKKKLVKVNKGISSNIFNIDSLFTSGKYTFKAYTNWMLNFKEPNHFEQQFFVIDPDIQTEAKTTKRETNYTIQVLPEGGHLLADVQNTLGIIVKNGHGIGLENAIGKIVDQNNTVITEFKLNSFGIGKSLINPKSTDSYRVIISKNTEEIMTIIAPAEEMGINMSLNKLRDNVILSIRTNALTNEDIKSKDYKLVIHNGNDIHEFSFNFNTKNEINKAINIESLSTGINIFTVFDDQNKPLLERIYFNYKNIVQIKTNVLSAAKVKDSLAVKLNLLASIDSTKISTVSISVLPSETKSYNFNSTILSKIYLEPYLKGFIQNSSYYFNTTTAKTQYDLDNLLLTQGWSSYNWNNIFNEPPSYTHNFEYGINTIVNINGKSKQGGYITNTLKYKNSEIFMIKDQDSAFNQIGLFPEDSESYKILKTNNKQSVKPQLYIQYIPSSVPLLHLNTPTPNHAFIGLGFTPLKNISKITPSWNNTGVEALDEVVVTADEIEKTRIEKIKASTFGIIQFLDDQTRNSAETIAAYLAKYGYKTNEKRGQLSIIDRRTDKRPFLILDGMVLSPEQYAFLGSFQVSNIDYVEMNKTGLGAMRLGVGTNSEPGGAGYIKIVTDPYKFPRQRQPTTNTSEYEFPLTFTSPKKFYVPSYKTYNSTFFKEYGTIAWLPNIKPNDNGILDFKFYDTHTDSVNLYIEGVLNNGTIISEIKTIELKN